MKDNSRYCLLHYLCWQISPQSHGPKFWIPPEQNLCHTNRNHTSNIFDITICHVWQKTCLKTILHLYISNLYPKQEFSLGIHKTFNNFFCLKHRQISFLTKLILHWYLLPYWEKNIHCAVHRKSKASMIIQTAFLLNLHVATMLLENT